MTEHTQGRLVVGTVAKLTICDVGGKFLPLARVTTPNGGGAEVRAEARENARRLVACWNACEGLSTDFLEDIDSIQAALTGQLVATRAEAYRCDALKTRLDIMTDERDKLARKVEELEFERTKPKETPESEIQRNKLLEALKNYVTVISTAGGGDKQLFMAAIRDADNKAREAIAYATGEPQ